MRLFGRREPHSDSSDTEDDSDAAAPASKLETDSETPEDAPFRTAAEEKAFVRNVLAEVMAQYGARSATDDSGDEPTGTGEEAPVVRLCNTIMQLAVKDRASDIHLEASRRGVRIRLRIDGVLEETMTMPNYMVSPVMRRFRYLAQVEPYTKASRQGAIAIRYQGREYGLRASFLPTLDGEQIALHILNSRPVIEWEQLGARSEMQKSFQELMQQGRGALLLAGPTGSGRTTTLLTLLNQLNTVERNIVLLEYAREFEMNGITQVEVDDKTVLEMMQVALAQDVDVLAVSEMRSPEVAAFLLNACQARPLGLLTLNAQSSFHAVARLRDMGISASQVVDGVAGILAQHLVRCICNDCKEWYDVANELRPFGYENAVVQIARGKGCEKCRHTGYYGRIGLFELRRMDAALTDLLLSGASERELRTGAHDIEGGNLREDGLAKILKGITTPEEVKRVLLV